MRKSEFDKLFAERYPVGSDISTADLELCYHSFKEQKIGCITPYQFNHWDLPRQYYNRSRRVILVYKGFQIDASTSAHPNVKTKAIFVEKREFRYKTKNGGYARALEMAKRYIDKRYKELTITTE